jgi:hypothetical protein
MMHLPDLFLALGPMVYAVCFIPEDEEQMLRDFGADGVWF